MEYDAERILTNLVRVGTVSDVDAEACMARVIYRDKDDMISGWLYVLQRQGETVAVSPGEDHVHAATVVAWMPSVGDTALCLYLPIRDADGFILGGI